MSSALAVSSQWGDEDDAPPAPSVEMVLAPRPGGAQLEQLQDLADEARDYVANSKAASTLRAYASDWRHFETWCAAKGVQSMPAAPQVVALYLTDLAHWAKASTLQRRLSSISQAHQALGEDSPTKDRLVATTHAGIRRRLGTAQVGKDPVLTSDLRAMVAELPDALLGVRDRALLLVGFAGAFRRWEELVSLNVDDVAERGDGLVVNLRRSKTDQEGGGREIGIPYGSNPATCPVRALRAWLEAAAIVEGPIFRAVTRHGHLAEGRLSDRAVALVVKRRCEAAGLDPARFAGHSLRAGLATSAAAAGVSERSIAAQTGHKSMTVLRKYVRHGSLFTENAAAAVGL